MRREHGAVDLPDSFFRLLADQGISALVVTGGSEHRIIFANRAFTVLAGAGVASMAGARMADVLPGIDVSALEEVRLTREPVRRAGQRLMLPPGEGATWWDLSSSPLPGEAAEDVRIVTTFQEVTDHIVSRQEAEAAQATLDALMGFIPTGVTIARGPGVVIERVSAYGRALTCRPESELVGIDAAARTDIWQIYAPGADTPMPAQDRPLARAITHGETTINQVLMLRRPDGGLLPLLCSSGPIRETDGRIVGAVMAWRDISDLHQAEAAAHAATERLKLALTAGSLAIWETDVKAGITRWDERLGAMLGLPPEAAEAEQGLLTSSIHPEDIQRVREEYDEALSTGRNFASEFRVRTATGGVRWLATQGVYAAGRAIGVARDITERRNREDQLRAALESRELLVREADHRIKNSLQLIADLLQLQQARLQDRDARGALADAIARVRTVAETHRSLHQSGDLASVDFGRMLVDICAHIDGLSAGVRVVADADDGIALDADRAIPLGLIVSELLTNSTRHAYPDGASGAVRARASVSADSVTVSISDDGVGNPAPPADGPPGLGTTIVNGLSKQIGATIESSSSAGRGTVTTVRLPRRPMSSASKS